MHPDKKRNRKKRHIALIGPNNPVVPSIRPIPLSGYGDYFVIMIDTYIKIYDWTLGLGWNLEKRYIYSVIFQFSAGRGFWAGMKVLSERTGIPKSRCKTIVKELMAEKAIYKYNDKIKDRTRMIFKITPEFVDKNAKMDGK